MESNQETMTSLLSRLCPVWNKLTDEEHARMASKARPRSYPAGAHIHSGKDDCVGVMLLARGTLRVFSLSDEGREITLFRVGPGEVCLLSASCVLPLITFDVFIDAQTDVDVIVVPAEAFQKTMENNPYMEAFAYRHMAERFSEVMWVMQQVLFVSFDKRLANYLISEAKEQHGPIIAATHDRIARDLGSAREVVSRMLKYFEREGLVKLDRGTITIVDMKRLRELAAQS